MTIDNTAAIRAWAITRADRLESERKTTGYPPAFEPQLLARIDELRMVVTLCDGLTKQNQQKASEK